MRNYEEEEDEEMSSGSSTPDSSSSSGIYDSELTLMNAQWERRRMGNGEVVYAI